MQTIKRLFDHAKRAYDGGQSPLAEIRDTATQCLQMLNSSAAFRPYGGCAGKNYGIYEASGQKSRPILPTLFQPDPRIFATQWDQLKQAAVPEQHRFAVPEAVANSTIYTAIMAFSACYDLWKPKSRKTPGTFFEVVLGSLLSLIIREANRTKFISLPAPPVNLVTSQSVETAIQQEAQLALIDDQDEEPAGDDPGKVSTDIVFNFPHAFGIVIPAKITTRERIVQPFAHQRILDCAMGVGRYISLLTCVSETQRDDKAQSVNEICVPGTIALFQQYLANLGGIYYLDPPQRYLQLSQTGLIEIRSVGALVTGGLDPLINRFQIAQAAVPFPGVPQ